MFSQSKLNSPDSSDSNLENVNGLKEEIAVKDKNIGNLKDQLSRAIEELALKESEIEILHATSSEKGDVSSEKTINSLNQEVAELKLSLAKAKNDSNQLKPNEEEVVLCRNITECSC